MPTPPPHSPTLHPPTRPLESGPATDLPGGSPVGTAAEPGAVVDPVAHSTGPGRSADEERGGRPAAAAALLAYALLLATCFSWAGNSIAGRMAAGEISPMVLTTLRWATAMLIAWPFARAHLRRDAAQLRAHWRRLALLGFTGFTLFNVLLYSALARTTAVNVVLVQAAMPAFIFALGFLAFRTRVVAAQVAGFAMSVVGVSLVVLGGGGEGLGGIGAGEALITIGVVVYAVYTLMLSRKPPVHWLSAIAVMGGFALLASLPFAAWEVARGIDAWPNAPRGWGLVLFTAVFPSLVAQVCFMRGVDLIGPNRAGLFVNLVPVMGTLMAVALLGEPFGARHALALALALGGVTLAEWGARRAAG